MQTRSRTRSQSGEFNRSAINPHSVEDEEEISEDESSEGEALHIEDTINFKQKEKEKGSEQNGVINRNPRELVCCILIAVLAVSYPAYHYLPNILFPQENLTTKLDSWNETYVEEYFERCNARFPSQSKDVWFTFAAGIKSIFIKDPTEPTTFLLFYRKGDKTVNCLVKEISKFTSECLKGNNDIISLKGKDLQKQIGKDSGEIITQFKDEVEKKKVMVIEDINDVPSQILKEFHYFCDTYQPLVRTAVYFFTMNTDDDIGVRKTVHQVEKSFTKIWGNTLDYNLLTPLMVRMTSNVIPVISEKHKSGC